jgi:hypothetical protein
MTRDPSALQAALACPEKHDPFSDALSIGLTPPALKGVRTRFVIEIVAHLHDALTDSLVTESEACLTFVRAVSMLNAFLPEEQAAMRIGVNRALARFVAVAQTTPIDLLHNDDHTPEPPPAVPDQRKPLKYYALTAAGTSWRWGRQSMSIPAAVRIGTDPLTTTAAGMDVAQAVHRWRQVTIQGRRVLGEPRPADLADVWTIRSPLRTEVFR